MRKKWSQKKELIFIKCQDTKRERRDTFSTEPTIEKLKSVCQT